MTPCAFRQVSNFVRSALKPPELEPDEPAEAAALEELVLELEPHAARQRTAIAAINVAAAGRRIRERFMMLCVPFVMAGGQPPEEKREPTDEPEPDPPEPLEPEPLEPEAPPKPPDRVPESVTEAAETAPPEPLTPETTTESPG